MQHSWQSRPYTLIIRVIKNFNPSLTTHSNNLLQKISAEFVNCSSIKFSRKHLFHSNESLFVKNWFLKPQLFFNVFITTSIGMPWRMQDCSSVACSSTVHYGQDQKLKIAQWASWLWSDKVSWCWTGVHRKLICTSCHIMQHG